MPSDINTRVSNLRTQLVKNNLSAFIIPSGDPHQSEYVPDRFKSREWISGFTGSAGTAVVTSDTAGLWTDSRYFLQGETELADSEFVLQKLVNQGAPEYVSWLAANLKAGDRVGIDADIVSLSAYERMSKILKEASIELVATGDLIDAVWDDRAALPSENIFTHDVKFAGQTLSEKLAAIRSFMDKNEMDWNLCVPLDATAWTLNLRGSDVECNPVFLAYLLVGITEVILFVGEGKLDSESTKQLGDNSIDVREYGDLKAFLKTISSDQVVGIDKAYTTVAVHESLKHTKLRFARTEAMKLKAIKNGTEIAHVRKVMEKDALALLRSFMWLRSNLESGVTEYELAMKLDEERRKTGDYYGMSFFPIVGYRGNGAIIHYRPEADTCSTIRPKGLLLIDSGGQYLDGTTDITRTLNMGDATEEEKRAFTLVLKGFIALCIAKFPRGTKGVQLDILARQFLWQEGMNYGHGTGHGVGFFMNVHEAPQGFTTGLGARGETAHVPGMLSSNEPGHYKENAYGIRIENLVVCQEDPDGFLSFENLTLFPIEKSLMDLSLLSEAERQWIDAYHKEVYDRVAPLCNEEEREVLAVMCSSL